MNNTGESNPRGAAILFILLLAVLIGAMALASAVQRDFGRVTVSNVHFPNYNAIPIRAKILRPAVSNSGNWFPGIVYLHGYQNNRETGDGYCIEMARRGFVVLNKAAIAEARAWMQQALNPPADYWSDPHCQTWPIWASLSKKTASIWTPVWSAGARQQPLFYLHLSVWESRPSKPFSLSQVIAPIPV